MRVEPLGTLTGVGSTAAFRLDFRRKENVRWSIFFSGTLGTSPSWKVQLSADGTNWVDVGSAFSTLPNKYSSVECAVWVRVTQTAGTGQSIACQLVW